MLQHCLSPLLSTGAHTASLLKGKINYLSFQTRRYTGQNVLQSAVHLYDTFGKEFTPQTLFQNKRVVVVGLPGNDPLDTFHTLPSYVNKAQSIREKGIDYILCVSVVDRHVPKAWQVSLDPSHQIAWFADIDGKFVEELGVATTIEQPNVNVPTKLLKSKRFSSIIDNGVIKVENVEEDQKSCKVSDADTILNQLDKK